MTKGRILLARWFDGLAHWNVRRTEEVTILLRWLDPKPGERILDVGCGDGFYDRRISRAGAHVLGIDTHEDKLRRARRLYGGPEAGFALMDASFPGFAPASFDKAVSMCVIEHFPDGERAILNVSKALKKEGLFVFSVDSMSVPSLTAEEMAFHRRRYAVRAYYTRGSLEPALARAGLEIEEAQYLHASPGSLRIFRRSWKLDALRGWRRVFKAPGYAALGITGAMALRSARPPVPTLENGLTLLIKARKRIGI